MGTRKRLAVPAWIGLLLIIIGFLAFVGSYFLLPLFVTTWNCFDSCTPPRRDTAWELSLNLLTSLRMALEITPLLLVLLSLPLLMAVLVMASSLGFLAHPDYAFEVWIQRGSLVGSIALILLLPFQMFWVRPEIGYLGMLAGYALFWAGHRVFLIAHPEARY